RHVVLVPGSRAVIELHTAEHLEGPTCERALVAHRDERRRVGEVGDLAVVLKAAVAANDGGAAVVADLRDRRADAELDRCSTGGAGSLCDGHGNEPAM